MRIYYKSTAKYSVRLSYTLTIKLMSEKTKKKDVKYDKTNLRVLSIPWGFSPCGTFNHELQNKDVKI